MQADPVEIVSWLGQAAAEWSSHAGSQVIKRALRRARNVADLDTILKRVRY